MASKKNGRFAVVPKNGAVKEGRKILFVFGVKDKFPDVENFGEFWGKTVFHCPFCLGWEVRDQPLAVFGNGATGIFELHKLPSYLKFHPRFLCR